MAPRKPQWPKQITIAAQHPFRAPSPLPFFPSPCALTLQLSRFAHSHHHHHSHTHSHPFKNQPHFVLVNCQYYTSGKPRRTKVCSTLRCIARSRSLSLAHALSSFLAHVVAFALAHTVSLLVLSALWLSVFLLEHSVCAKLTHKKGKAK